MKEDEKKADSGSTGKQDTCNEKVMRMSMISQCNVPTISPFA
jgi:hypothetical protein